MQTTIPSADVTFVSDGHRLVGQLYRPPDRGDEPVPVVVLCAGWVGGRYHRAADFAAGLAAGGLALLSFEYRGWGESEGDRTRLWPQEQAVDVLAAVAYLRGRADIDADRIALFGKEHGSAVALQAAVTDPAIAALIMMFPVGDGYEWMRSIRRPWEWHELLDLVDQDRRARALGAPSQSIDPSDVLLVDPYTEKRRAQRRASSSEFAEWQLTVESVEQLLAFRPVDGAHRLSPRPVLGFAVERDNTVPIDGVRSLFAKLPGPKELVVLPEVPHYEAYAPEHLGRLLSRSVDFLWSVFDDGPPTRGRQPGSRQPGGRQLGGRQ